jgi:putative glutamine amidotransferase
MRKPIIGVTLDFVGNNDGVGSFSARPHYAIRESYFDSIRLAGGIPMGIPFQADLIDEYLDLIDGIIIPGGDFALDPSWYVAGDAPKFLPSKRLAFDVEIIRKALEQDMPLLGICAGMQILAGMHGCKLASDITKYSKTHVSHRGIDPYQYAHNVIVESDSLLEDISQVQEFGVNSHHNEGVVEVAGDIKISGISGDGVIEAIEVAGKKFALGVQWHPEFFLDAEDNNFEIVKALVFAAK